MVDTECLIVFCFCLIWSSYNKDLVVVIVW